MATQQQLADLPLSFRQHGFSESLKTIDQFSVYGIAIGCNIFACGPLSPDPGHTGLYRWLDQLQALQLRLCKHVITAADNQDQRRVAGDVRQIIHFVQQVRLVAVLAVILRPEAEARLISSIATTCAR